MSDKCPTCDLTDGMYDRAKTRKCNDPWHGDDHLRRKSIEYPPAAIGDREARARTATTERAERQSTTRMRADIAREHFEQNLANFVKMWAPHDNMRESDRFQRDLMMLFRDAMEHKSHVFGLHMERTDMTLDTLSMHATGSLQAIYKPPTHARDVSDQILDRCNPKKET